MNQVWIFLTVGFGMSLLLVVVIITMALCCMVYVYQIREEKYTCPNFCPDMNMIPCSRGRLTGMASNSALMTAIQQSFTSQAQYVVNTINIEQGRE